MNRISLSGLVLSGLLSCALLGSCTSPTATCRDSYYIQVFGIDPRSGALSDEPLNTLHFDSDQPVCIAF